MTYTYTKCPHCKHVQCTAGYKAYEYTIGTPLRACEACGRPVLDDRKREWIMLSSVQKVWHFITFRSVVISLFISVFTFNPLSEWLGNEVVWFIWILIIVMITSVLGYVRYHEKDVQQEIQESIQRTKDLQYRDFLAKHYTLYDDRIPFKS